MTDDAIVWEGPAELRAFLRPLAELQPDPNNARMHGDRNHEANRLSLERNGQYLPLVVHDDVVMIGNDRMSCMLELGWTHAAVVDVSTMSADAVQALALADNKIGELGEWNLSKLSGQLRSLDDSLKPLTGFQGHEWKPLIASAAWPETLEGAQAAPAGSGQRTMFHATQQQGRVIRRGLEAVRRAGELPDETPDGRLLELMAADYLSGEESQ